MKNKILLGTLIALGVVCVAVGSFWLGSQNKAQVSKQTDTNTQTTETKKADKLYTLYSGDWGGIEVANTEALGLLNISTKLKEYLAKTVSEQDSRGCGTPVVKLTQVYGDYAFADIHPGGGLTNYEREARGCFGGGTRILLGLKNGKVENLAGFQAVPTCAEKASWGAPEELIKDIPCDN